jgi:hypothetical protein
VPHNRGLIVPLDFIHADELIDRVSCAASVTAEDCRSRAAECERRVGSVGHFELKVQYRELALEWRSLAEQLEQLAARNGERALMEPAT